MSDRRASHRRIRHQAGAISVLAVMLIALVGMAALVSIDVGHVFYRQRQLQNMVDLAAMSGAQQLKAAGTVATQSTNVLAVAQGMASQNGYSDPVSASCATATGGAADVMRVCLGVWDPAYATALHFDPAYNPATLSPNAVRVEATQTVPFLFVMPGGPARQLHAQAIASGSTPVAAFSLASGLLDVNTASSALGFLLGNTVTLSAVDWQGLVNTSVTLDQLRLKAGVGTVDQLLKTGLTIQQFYALVLGAAGKDALLAAALGSPATALGVTGASANMMLGQMLNLGVLTPTVSSAAEVGLNVATLLMLGAQVANTNSALNVPLTFALPAGITSVGAHLTVVQPPVMAVGPARQLSSAPATWQTTAHTAQVGLRLDVVATTSLDPRKSTTPLSLAISLLLAPVGWLLPINVSVPLYVEAASATASLQSIQCAAAVADRCATLGVSTGIVTACLAGPTGAGCSPTNSAQLVNASLLAGAVQVNITGSVSPRRSTVPVNSTTVTLAPGQTTTVGSSQPLKGVLNDLIANIVPTVNVTVLGIPLLNIPLDLTALLSPLVNLLDPVINGLLTALGIQLGTATLWMHNIDCNNAELVF